MQGPTELLMTDHRIIEVVLNVLERMANCWESENALDVASARSAVVFCRDFADGCHHGKEEGILFPALERKGLPAQEGPTAQMRLEHERARALIRGMQAAIEKSARNTPETRQAFVENARGYVTLLRDHILKENHCLFSIANEILEDSERCELTESFEAFDRDDAIGDDYLRLRRIAVTLARTFGVSTEGIPSLYAEGMSTL